MISLRLSTFAARALLATALLLSTGCVSCSGLSAMAAAPAARAAAFQLHVWDESFVGGGSAHDFALAVRQSDGAVLVDVLAKGARALKALYCDVQYDGQFYTPAGGTPHALGASGSGGAPVMLHLMQPVAAGELHYGQVLADYDKQPGFSGNQLLATLKFAAGTADGAAQAPARNASTPPDDHVIVNDTLTVDGSGILRWRYYATGDYDQNGEVNIADLTPLGAHYGESGPFDPLGAVYCVDGDRNSALTIADITPIGAQYGRRVSTYRIYASADTADYPGGGLATSRVASVAQLVGEAPFERPGGGITERIAMQYQLSGPPADSHYWVRPSDEDSDGLPSNMVTAGAPQVSAVQPLSGQSGAQVICTAALSGTTPFTYAWDFGGGASPNASNLAMPQVTLAAEGTYNCSLSVTNAFGNASFPFTLTVSGTPPPAQLELWYYTMMNLLPDQGLADAETLLDRAAAAGYTKVVHADYKFGNIDLQSQTYYDHLTEYVNHAAADNIEIIPALVPIGYSNTILNHDPNLIEGQPVRDAEFVVSGTTADSWQDPTTTITNGGFEDFSGNDFAGWNEMDNPGTTFADTNEKHSGAASMRLENFTANLYGHGRVSLPITVAPWNCYAISFWLKTQNLSPTSGLNFYLFNGDFSKTLSFLSFNVQSTQEWTQYYLIFNSQQNDQVNLYMGMWGGQSGQMWLDDVSIVNAGLVNLIRRPGAPFTVKSENGSITYAEGVDYDAVSDPHMGTQGTWNMDYDLYHERPLISIRPGRGINDGDRLKVSYYHAVFVYDMQPTCCLTEEGVYDVIRTTLTEINTRMHPKAVFIGVDEMRVANWCEGCQSTGKTPGQLLADCTQRIDTIAHEINPQWKLLTWSDMYDPNHNAVDNYYLVNGTLAGSWNGLPASWEIGNWMSDPAKRVATMGFFADHGNRQILAGYYDEPGPDYTMDEWLTDAAGIEGVYAVMYTTWWRGFDALENWASQVREWESQQPR